MKDYAHLQDKKIRYRHLFQRSEPEDVVVVGIVREKGITLVYIDRPWDIAFCLTPDITNYENKFSLCCEAIEAGFFDGAEMVAKDLGLSANDIRLFLIKEYINGKAGKFFSSQGELHEQCPFDK